MLNRFESSDIETLEEYKEFFDNLIGKAGRELGLDYKIEDIISGNSIHAHMGLQYAIINNKQDEYFRKVMSGHWETGKDYYSFSFIDLVLSELNLDVEDFHNREDEMKKLVEKDINLAGERKIDTVPTFYRDGDIVIGTGSFNKFRDILK